MHDSPDGKIRVAHLIHTMAYGGIETALLNWVKTMNRDRFDVRLFCFANPGCTERPFLHAATRQQLEVGTVPWSRYKPVWRAGRAMAERIRESKIDILHCHNTYANLVGAVAGRLTKAKTVTTLYVWGKFGFKRAVLQWLDRALLRYFDQITAHCEDTLRGTIARGFSPKQVRLLTCGFADRVAHLTAEERGIKRAAMGASAESEVLVTVSRFWPEKAHDVLLEAFRLIRSRRPQTVLWLPGVGPELPRIRHLCTELGLDEHVRFLGFWSELPELLALADLQIHPSDMEGVPLAVCAGMAAGLPIVATAVGGLTEILRHGHSATLVAPRSPAALADAVAALLQDPDKRRALGAAAQRFIEQEYSLAAATRRVESLYEEMMAR